MEKILTSEQIADNLLSDINSYSENIKDMIVRLLEKQPNSKNYWDAWFRGAENKELEKAEKGVIYKQI